MEEQKLPEWAYRYITDRDVEEYEFLASVKLVCRKFKVTKETPCGYWIIINAYRKPKWISKNAAKSFAFVDKEKALDHYIRRTNTYIGILKAKTKVAEQGLAMAKIEAGVV